MRACHADLRLIFDTFHTKGVEGQVAGTSHEFEFAGQVARTKLWSLLLELLFFFLQKWLVHTMGRIDGMFRDLLQGLVPGTRDSCRKWSELVAHAAIVFVTSHFTISGYAACLLFYQPRPLANSRSPSNRRRLGTFTADVTSKHARDDWGRGCSLTWWRDLEVFHKDNSSVDNVVVTAKLYILFTTSKRKYMLVWFGNRYMDSKNSSDSPNWTRPTDFFFHQITSKIGQHLGVSRTVYILFQGALLLWSFFVRIVINLRSHWLLRVHFKFSCEVQNSTYDSKSCCVHLVTVGLVRRIKGKR